VISPNVFNMDLWVQSGHAANYKEDMFVLEVYIYFCLHVFFCKIKCWMY